MPIGVDRIASASTLSSPVEVEEIGLIASQVCRVLNFVVGYGKVGEAAAKGEQGFSGGLAVFSVLLDGVRDALTRKRVFEFGCGDGNAVDEERYVDGVAVFLRVAKLADDGVAVVLEEDRVLVLSALTGEK